MFIYKRMLYSECLLHCYIGTLLDSSRRNTGSIDHKMLGGRDSRRGDGALPSYDGEYVDEDSWTEVKQQELEYAVRSDLLTELNVLHRV